MKIVDLVVVGSGPSGYSAALEGSKLGLKVIIVEKFLLGGTCLNIGCIPSKFFLHLSYVHFLFKKYSNSVLMHSSLIGKGYKSKAVLLTKLRTGLSFLFKKYGVILVEGKLKSFTDKSVEVLLKKGGLVNFRLKFLVVSVGSKPSNKNFKNTYDVGSILSSNEALNLKGVPKSVLIVGAGAIGVELATIYRSLGSDVTLIEASSKAVPSFDSEVSEYFLSLNESKFKFLLNFKVTGVYKHGKGLFITLSNGSNGEELSFKTNRMVVCVGRVPSCLQNKGYFSLDKDNRGVFIVNRKLQTKFSNICVVGDAISGPMLAHKAEREGVSAPHLLTQNKFRGLRYDLIPNVIYSEPEVASVGLLDKESRSLNISFFSKDTSFNSNGRSLSSEDGKGLLKLSVCTSNGRLLGCQVINKSSSDIIAVLTVFMLYKGTVFDVVSAVFPHPTLSELIYTTASCLIDESFKV